MGKRLTPEEREQRILTAIEGRFVLVGQDESNKYRFRCDVDGCEWSATFNNIVGRRSGCPRCSGKERYTPETLHEMLNKKIGSKYEFGFDTFDGRNTRLKLKCKIDGCEWSASFNSLSSKGSGCPRCSGHERYTPESVIEVLKRKVDINYEFSIGDFAGGNTTVRLRCKLDGYEWNSNVVSIASNRVNCQRCIGKERHTPESITRILTEKIGSKYDFRFDVFNGSNTKLRLKCKTDGCEWSTKFNNINGGQGCPVCAVRGFKPDKPGDFYMNIGTFELGQFTKYGVTQRVGNSRINEQIRSSSRITDYRQVWREHFDSGTDALLAERYFASLCGTNIPKENLPDGYTETITNIHPCQVVLHLIFGFHRPDKKK